MRRLCLLFAALIACGEAQGPSALDGGVGADAAADLGVGVDLGLPSPDAGEHPDAMSLDAVTLDAEPVDLGVPDPDAGIEREPVIFVHGIGGSSAEFEVLKARLVADGWSPDRLYALDYPSPRWGCNVDNAEFLRQRVEEILAATGARRVDLVAHSMGTLSSRYFLERLGGLAQVSTYVTLGGLHHGNRSACLNPLPVCVWQELCPTNPYLTDLNMEPIDLGPVHWVSICSRSDDTADLETCRFDPAENIEVDGVDHAGANGLLEHVIVYPHLLRVLDYPSPP